MNALSFDKYASLRVLDLSGCRLNPGNMETMADACKEHAALIEVRIEGNDISDSDRIRLMEVTKHNREAIEAKAFYAYDWLATNATGSVDF